MDDDVVIDDLHLLAAGHLRGCAGEQAPSSRCDGDAGHTEGRGGRDDVRNSEAAFHTITLLSSFRNDTS
jgi:hypothetical protein